MASKTSKLSSLFILILLSITIIETSELEDCINEANEIFSLCVSTHELKMSEIKESEGDKQEKSCKAIKNLFVCVQIIKNNPKVEDCIQNIYKNFEKQLLEKKEIYDKCFKEEDSKEKDLKTTDATNENNSAKVFDTIIVLLVAMNVLIQAV